MPTPVPCATPAGRLRNIHERTPVTEIVVNITPIRKIAPSTTVGGSPLPSTRSNAVKAVSEMAQPMAMGRFAHRPISIEPNALVRHTAMNTALLSTPASPNIPGTTTTENTMVRNVVMPASVSWRNDRPHAAMPHHTYSFFADRDSEVP